MRGGVLSVALGLMGVTPVAVGTALVTAEADGFTSNAIAFTVLPARLDALTITGYPVASVLHGVWRAAPGDNRIGLVFINWTDTPAAWTGSCGSRRSAASGRWSGAACSSTATTRTLPG